MSRRVRNLLIAGLVLLLCCFGGSIGNPFGGGDDSGLDNDFVRLLGRLAGDSAVVPDKAIQAPCRTAVNRFEFTGACTLTVEGGGEGLRNLVLRGNRAMTLTARVPRDDFIVSNEVAPDEQVKVAIDSEGGQVVLGCPGLQTCIVLREDKS